jgi:hypothetical protein
MKRSGQCSLVIAAGVLGVALAWIPAAAQQVTVQGLVVNLGITSAAMALRDGGHRDSHPTNPPSGSQHLLITLDDEKSGKRISDAEVTLEVTDPRGRMEKKPLLHTTGGGLPDYSELFVFGWSGEYSVRVIITPHPGTKPVETRFKVHHVV